MANRLAKVGCMAYVTMALKGLMGTSLKVALLKLPEI
jgi:hypothetical protein